MTYRVIQPNESGDEYLTTKEAAALCGVGPSAVRVWVHRGHLKPVGVGTGWPYRLMYRRADVLSCNANRTAQTRTRIETR